MSTTVYAQGKKPLGYYPKFKFIMSYVTANPLITLLSTDTRDHAAFGGFASDPDRLPSPPTGYGIAGNGVVS